MSLIPQLFAQATAAHGAGDAARAEALYRQILALSPDHPDCWHLLGRLALEHGNPQAAVDLIGQALRLRPRIAEYHATLAQTQTALGRPGEAVETLRKAVRMKPESALIQYHHGLALSQAGQGTQSIQAFRRAVARDPALLAAHQALGAALMAEGQPAQAAEAFRAALRLAPNDAEGLFNLGCALQHSGDLRGAEHNFKAAAARRPGYLHATNNVGIVLQSMGRLDEAAEWLRQAIAIAPASPPAYVNLGLVLRDLSRFAAAEAEFRAAEAMNPTAESACCIANTLRDQGRLAESLELLKLALSRDANHQESHISMAFTRMIAGDLPAGWPHFAWRGAAAHGRARIAAATPAPAWRGERCSGTLLIYAEQGAGDFFQMCRYVAMAAERVRHVVLHVPPPLKRLAQSVPGAAAVFATGEKLPPIAAVCADLDLPGLFATSIETIPASVPYLHAPEPDIAAWRERLSALPGAKIGLAWAGNPAYLADRQRSVPATDLAALAGTPGVTFVSLQPGISPQPGAKPPAGLSITDWSNELTDFAATAALIAALDLTIAVDSAVAHLAGALGRPVWLLNRFAPDWRWLLGRHDSPWYPTLRQFRQTTPGDWPRVLAHVRAALTPESGASLP
jgi:tetratricopeptide (TPR) repeat protein